MSLTQTCNKTIVFKTIWWSKKLSCIRGIIFINNFTTTFFKC